jgi:hypothetical protein
MNEECHYDDEYIENMMLPFSYTDAYIIGKACYYYREEEESFLVSKNLEHRFTNRLNTNTVVIKMNDRVHKLIDKNFIENLKKYMISSYNGKNMYSADRFDFIDGDYRYHHIYKKEINITKLYNHGNYENENTLPVVMCLYKRVNLLKNTIECLNKQKDKNFCLYIWNNSPTTESDLINMINQYRPKFNVFGYTSDENVGGIGRFYLTRQINKEKHIKYVIFVDDDELFEDNFISYLRSVAKEKCSWNYYGKKFIKGCPYIYLDKNGAYDDKLNDKNKVHVNYGETYDYGGTGGMIIDSSLFDDDEFYYSFPKEYILVEDLWMSFYGNLFKGYNFYKARIDIKLIKDDKNTCTNIWDLKNHLLEYCRRNGWNV